MLSPSMSGQSIPAKRGLQLDRVVLLGRTFEEYRRYFLLEPHELIGKKVLDVAGGVSSFCAEASNLGIKVTAFDPIYSLSLEKIRERVLEIMRVTQGEARIYPTVTFEAQPSEYIPMLKSDRALRQFAFTEIKTNFEFLVNSNSYLRVTRA
jgi:hypothetical protein